MIGGSVAIRMPKKIQKYKKTYMKRTNTINKIHEGRDNRSLKEEVRNEKRRFYIKR